MQSSLIVSCAPGGSLVACMDIGREGGGGGGGFPVLPQFNDNFS